MTVRITNRDSRFQWLALPKPSRTARLCLGAVSALSQSAGALCAELAFRHPPRFHATPRELARLSEGVPCFVRGRRGEGEIAMWQWGSGPRVLLAHGWGSHAGRLTSLVPALLAAGFGVTAFDAPGHGASPGHFASLPEFIEALTLVARAVSPVALVGHSLGAAASALGLYGGLDARAAVLLSVPADPAGYTRRYARWMRLSPAVTEAMRRRLEARYGSLDEYRLADRPPGVPTLIVHDRGDTRVSIGNARVLAKAWPNARLVETQGLGHHRILRDAAVVRLVQGFLSHAIFGSVSEAWPPRRPAEGVPSASVARFLKPGAVARSRAEGGCQ